MKIAICLAFLSVIAFSTPSIGKGQNMICTYATGAEIVIDLTKEHKSKIELTRISPQKMMTQKIFVDNQNKPSEVDDFVEISAKGKSITYPLKCKVE